MATSPLGGTTEQEGVRMINYFITAESFGADCPDNWRQIADYLNGVIRDRGIEFNRSAVNALWDDFWSDRLDRTPDDFEEGE